MSSPVTLVNLTGFQAGMLADEGGVNAKSFKSTVKPEFKNFVQNKYGTKRGFSVAPMELDVAIEGEVSGDTGLMAATATAAVTVANSTAYFGAPTTGLYLDEGEVTEARDNGEMKSMSMKLSANAGIP